eukprot:s3016_g3.t1
MVLSGGAYGGCKLEGPILSDTLRQSVLACQEKLLEAQSVRDMFAKDTDMYRSELKVTRDEKIALEEELKKSQDRCREERTARLKPRSLCISVYLHCPQHDDDGRPDFPTSGQTSCVNALTRPARPAVSHHELRRRFRRRWRLRLKFRNSNWTMRACLWRASGKSMACPHHADLAPQRGGISKLKALASKGKGRAVLEVLAAMQGVSVLHVNASMTAFGKATHWQACMELFFSLPELKATPDVVTYSAAISACQKGGQWQLPLELFERAEQTISPDVVHWVRVKSALSGNQHYGCCSTCRRHASAQITLATRLPSGPAAVLKTGKWQCISFEKCPGPPSLRM